MAQSSVLGDEDEHKEEKREKKHEEKRRKEMTNTKKKKTWTEKRRYDKNQKPQVRKIEPNMKIDQQNRGFLPQDNSQWRIEENKAELNKSHLKNVKMIV